jgi:hypothetical protein
MLSDSCYEASNLCTFGLVLQSGNGNTEMNVVFREKLCVPYWCIEEYLIITRQTNKETFINAFNHVLFFSNVF